MSSKQKWIGGFLLVLAAYATGYYEAPYKTKTEIKTVEVEKKTEKQNTNTEDHSKTVKVEERKPDGTVTTTTTVDNSIDTHVSTVDTSSMNKASDSIKEVTKSGSPTTVSFLAGASLTKGLGSSTIVYGGLISKPVMGPISITVWGLSDMTFGGGLGIQF